MEWACQDKGQFYGTKMRTVEAPEQHSSTFNSATINLKSYCVKLMKLRYGQAEFCDF